MQTILHTTLQKITDEVRAAGDRKLKNASHGTISTAINMLQANSNKDSEATITVDMQTTLHHITDARWRNICSYTGSLVYVGYATLHTRHDNR